MQAVCDLRDLALKGGEVDDLLCLLRIVGDIVHAKRKKDLTAVFFYPSVW